MNTPDANRRPEDRPPQLPCLVLQLLVLVVAIPTTSYAFHFPWDQGHDTTDWEDPEDPGPCEGPNCDPCGSTGSPVYLQTGHFVRTDVDIEIPGRVTLSVRRTYNSNDPRKGLFGSSWSAGCNVALYETTASRDVDGDGEAEVITDYILRLPNGKRYTYTDNGDGNVQPPAGRFDSVVPQADGTVELMNRIGNKLVFADNGLLLAEVDRFGNTKSYEYTVDGALERIVGQAGRSLTLSYNTAGFVSSITDHTGRIWSYGYDANGNLTTLTDPLGGIKRYDYVGYSPPGDAFVYQLLTRITDQAGVVVDQVTYSNGKVNAHTDRQNRYTYTYNTAAGRVTKRDAVGDQTVYDYDDSGQIVRVQNGVGAVTTMDFNENGRMTRNTDPSGYTWQATYDDRGRKLTETDPLGNVTTFEYDGDNPNPVRIISRTGRVTAIAYDGFNQPISVTDNESNTFSMSFDSDGDLVTFTDAVGATAQYDHDAAGQTIRITDPLGRSSTYSYDDVGNMLTVTNGAGETTTMNYDTLTRVTSLTDSLGNTSMYAYDGAGRLQSVTDPEGGVTAYDYDTHGRLSQRVAPNGHTKRYAYSLDNTLLSITRGDGTVLRYDYDGAKRLTRRDAAGEITDYDYDARGLLVGADNNVGLVTRQFDELGRLVGETFDGDAITRTLNAEGERIAINVLGVETTYERDGRGRITRVAAPYGALAFENDAVGRRTSLQRSNGAVTSYAYDAAGQVTGLQHTGLFDAGYSYTYDDAGRIIRWTGDGADWEYEYDVGGRLLRAEHGAEQFDYAYDARGNRTGGGQVYDDNNVLLSDTEFDYSYDANDNLVQKTHRSTGVRTTYEWTQLHQLAAVREYPDGEATTPPSKVITYAYGPLDRRWNRTEDGAAERYVYDGMNRVATLDGSDTIVARVTFGPRHDDPLVMDIAGDVRFYHQNHQGSVMALTDETSVTDTYTYDPYGNTLVTGSTENPFRYTAREAEDEESYYYRARYYSASLGRFLSPDPIGFRSGDLNVYRYVLGDPVNTRDPMGTHTMVIGGGIGGSIADGPGVVAGVVIGGLVLIGGYIIYNEIADDSGEDTSDDRPESPPIPDVPPIPDDPAQCPGDGWDWRGNPDYPVGSDKGSWHNPETGESLHPDLDHGPPIGPHWDYTDPDGNGWRVFPDGSVQPK